MGRSNGTILFEGQAATGSNSFVDSVFTRCLGGKLPFLNLVKMYALYYVICLDYDEPLHRNC